MEDWRLMAVKHPYACINNKESKVNFKYLTCLYQHNKETKPEK